MARSTFSSQNAQNTTISDQVLKFRCSKMARRCGAKHIFKSKCTKHHNLGPIFEVPMFKNGTPLWREAHFQVKLCKKLQYGSNFGSFDPAKLQAAVARSTFASQNAQNTTIAGQFWKFPSGKIARRCGAKHICKSKCGKIDGYEGLMSKNRTPLWREADLQVKMFKTPAFCSILKRF